MRNFDLLKAFDNIDLNKREIIDLKNVKVIIDPTLEGYLTKLVDSEGNVISPIIRGFKAINDLNNFLMGRFGIMIDENFVPYIKGNAMPRFKEIYVKEWERIN